MTQISQINKNHYYTSNAKLESPKPLVVSGPQTLPSTHVFNDLDARRKFEIVNQEINSKSKKEKGKQFRNFVKVFGGIVLVILGALGLKKILK